MQIEKLSYLVAQKQKLQDIMASYAGQREYWMSIIDSVAQINTGDTYSDPFIRNQTSAVHGLLDQLNNLLQSQQQHIAEINSMIQGIESQLVSQGWYTQTLGISDDTRRNWQVDYRVQNEMVACTSMNLSWQLPCLLINCGTENIVTVATKSFQLYIADTSDAIMEEAKRKATSPGSPVRMRSYNLHSFNDMDLSQLPVNAFGYIIVWQVFTRLTLPIIERCLVQFKQLLRPGGRVLFNVNDCETEIGAKLASNPVVNSYVTKPLLTDILDRHGYELASWTLATSSMAVVEIKVPGESTSYKSQAGRGLIKRYTS